MQKYCISKYDEKDFHGFVTWDGNRSIHNGGGSEDLIRQVLKSVHNATLKGLKHSQKQMQLRLADECLTAYEGAWF